MIKEYYFKNTCQSKLNLCRFQNKTKSKREIEFILLIVLQTYAVYILIHMFVCKKTKLEGENWTHIFLRNFLKSANASNVNRSIPTPHSFFLDSITSKQNLIAHRHHCGVFLTFFSYSFSSFFFSALKIEWPVAHK